MGLEVFCFIVVSIYFFCRNFFHLILNKNCVMYPFLLRLKNKESKLIYPLFLRLENRTSTFIYPFFLRLKNMVSVFLLFLQLENKTSTLIYPFFLRLENTAFTLRNGCSLVLPPPKSWWLHAHECSAWATNVLFFSLGM